MRKTDDRIAIVDAVCDVETSEKPFGGRWHHDEITLRPEHLAGAAGPEKEEKAVIGGRELKMEDIGYGG